jgi:hypothetical protein
MPVFATWLALVLTIGPADISAPWNPSPPYKTDSDWSYFRDGPMCSAAAFRPAGETALVLAYDGKEKFFSVGFTRPLTAGLKAGEGREMDVRLHRAAGVLDEGWEGVHFGVLPFDQGSMLMVSQPMADPAAKDFAEMHAVEFIDRGKTAGYFRMRNPSRAVKEIIRCSKEAAAKS